MRSVNSAKKVPIQVEKHQYKARVSPIMSLLSGSIIGFLRFLLRPYYFYVFRPHKCVRVRFIKRFLSEWAATLTAIKDKKVPTKVPTL